MPRGYKAMIWSLKASSRFWPLRTIFGSEPFSAARHGQFHRTDVRHQRLAATAVAAVPDPRPAGPCFS
jgi:hypothetical protein